MGEPKTRPTTASVADFLALLPEPRRADCDAIMAMMQAATGEPAVMWGSIVGYGRNANTRSDGKLDEWPLAGFSPRKQALTVYLVPGFDRDAARMARLGKHSTSKACLYIKRLSDVDVGVLKKMIERSVKAMESRRLRD